MKTKAKPRKPRAPRVRTTRARHKGIGTWGAQCRDCKTKFRVLWGAKPKFCIACKSENLGIKAGHLTAHERADRDARIVSAGIRLAILFLEALLGGMPPPTFPKRPPTITREDAAAFIAGFSETPKDYILDSTEARESAYRRAARACHPDSGGSHDLFVKLQQAKEALAR